MVITMNDPACPRQFQRMDSDEEAISALALAIVTDVAPEERPLFVSVARAWFATPNRERKGSGTDDVLGFGLGAAADLLTPVVLAIAVKLASYLAEELSKALVKSAANEVLDRLKRLFCGDAGAVTLSGEQLTQVRALSLTVAREEKLSEATAERLANAIVAHFGSSTAAR